MQLLTPNQKRPYQSKTFFLYFFLLHNFYLRMIYPIQIRRDLIVGTRKIENYFWTFILFVGGIRFITVNTLPDSQDFEITVAQQLVMGLYGYIALYTALYLTCSIFWNVGAGYNEYNKEQQLLKIVRWGFPGKNRKIQVEIPFSSIQALSIQTKDSFFSRNSVNLQYENGKSIPLLQPNQTLTLDELETYATQIAFFIQVPLT